MHNSIANYREGPPMTPPAEPPFVLLPCPFCGNEKLFEGQGEQYFIECERCYKTFGTTVSAEGNARHDAVAMWNRRIAPAAPRAQGGEVEAAEATTRIIVRQGDKRIAELTAAVQSARKSGETDGK